MNRKFISRKELKQKIQEDQTDRTTISFYRYVNLKNPEEFKEILTNKYSELGVLGRIYVAHEGINAQFSVPTKNLEKFRNLVDSMIETKDIPFKIAVEDDGKSFYKLTIKTRNKVLADGLNDDTFDTSNVGNHLNAKEFNKAIEEGATVIDMRNHYEAEVGTFENALTFDGDTFREVLPMALKEVENKKSQKILLFCTGGIRCEKASAYFKHKGFTDVNQLHGGIIDYKHQCEKENLDIKFKGKNFVFDERLGEKITDDIISNCHQCGAPCDDHTNCANDDCHLLFIQCPTCKEKTQNTCSTKCQEIAGLPVEEQRKLRRNKVKTDCLSVYKSRLRPKLNV
ncbi:hypothetical protein CL656_03420 [bacterium]|nr:hypothetical protein [bacterium]